MAAHPAEGVLAEGTLQKHSPSKVLVKRWQTRYFVLSSSSPAATTLAYFKRKGDGTPKGVIDLAQVRRLTMRPGSGKMSVFELETAGGRTYSLAAHSKSDAQRWVNALNTARGSGESPTVGKREQHTSGLLHWKLLTGERVLAQHDVVIISHHALTDGRQGQLQMTPYRFVLTIEQQCESVPLGLLARIENAKHEKRGLPGYLLICKDFRTISVFFLSTDALEAMNLLFKHHLFPTKLRDLYAFHNKEKYSLRSELHGWPLYQIDQEFERQQLDSAKWRLTQVNAQEYRAHPRLPNRFIVPASIPDELLVGPSDGSHKWSRWIIALCWSPRVKPSSAPRGCLLRGVSVPGTDAERTKRPLETDASGTKQTTEGDGVGRGQHAVLEHVLQLYPQAQALHVYNCIKSTELPSGTTETVKTASGVISFCTVKLPSPAAVEQSLLKLAHLISSLNVSDISAAALSSDTGAASTMRAAWVNSLHDTQWLSGVRMLLQTTLDIVELIRHGNPVFVQSPDPGDAAPQVTSLVQLCMDPYFRTIAGFCLLIEKEWMACAHTWGQQHKEKPQPKKFSHMFVQFIDAVWQLWDTAPAAFEFDCSLLLFLLESVYSARFGSFLADTQRERLESKLQLTSQTISVWSFIDAHPWKFGHALYDRHDAATRGSLLPQPNCVKIWTGYYLRWACLAPYEQALAELQKGSAVAGEAPALATLSLAHRGLASIPPLIFESFIGLTTLDLSHNFLSILPDVSPLASSLEQLVLSHNLLTCLPSQLVTALPLFTRLTHLSLAHNRLPDLSALPYRKLPSLVHLDVSYNALQALPSRLARLTQLQHLNLAGNSIGPAFSSKLIDNLTLLEELDLHGCALVGLPPNIDKLSKLRVLDLSDNPNLQSLPSGLWSLTSLRELYARDISRSQDKRPSDLVSTLVTQVGRLTQLKSLDLANNDITDFPATSLVALTQIERLRLNGNGLTTLAGEIGRLSSLRELDLSRNRLTSLPPEMAGLVQLAVLNVEDNRLAALPAQLGTLPHLGELSVGAQNGCIRCPPEEIACMGSQSIMAYLSQLLHGQKPCHRIKIMFVGQENVGKTSLLRALKKREKRASKPRLGRSIADDTVTAPLSTDGIDINKWTMSMPCWGPNGPSIELSAWDFAGQEIYYATHRFFLSERSMYLAVFNLVTPDQSHIEYWLHSVRTAAGSSPVVIIGTHVESTTCTDDYLAEMRARLNKRFCQRFPNVVSIHFVSCSTGQGIDLLLTDLKEIVAKQEHIGQALPANYLELEKILVNLPKERMPPILPWSEYQSLARLCLVEEEHDLRAATSLLHNLGSIVHFPNDEKLKDVVILDPQWLMKVMSTVFSTKHSYCKNGVVAHSALAHIWKPPMFPVEVHGFLLSLLERFELSFPVGTHADKLGDQALTWLRPTVGSTSPQPVKELYLVPSLLPEARPALVAYVWPLRQIPGETIFGRCYRFEFIPKGFMGRLIIRLLAFPLTVQICWLTGLLASIGREKILVEISPDDLMLNITVRTELKGEHMSNLSWLVFAAVDSLVKEWYNLNAKVLVPCSHCMSVDLKSAPFMFAMEKCQQAATTPNESILLCPNDPYEGDPKPVRLDHIAPDLAMVHLDQHRIEWSDLIKSEDGKPMAEGGYASVYRGTYFGAAVAIKELKGTVVDEFDLASGINVDDEARRLTYEEFRHEVWIMSGLAHPNLVRLRGFCLQPPCIVTELVPGGSLFDFLSDPDRSSALDWPLRLKIAKDIAKGCAFLHNTSPPVMHRDLKSPNILLANLSPDASVVAKLCDFGLSLSSDSAASRKVDCPVWLAPEILEGKPYSEKADLYSVGVILWELLTKQNYFGEVRFFSVLEDLVKAGRRPSIPNSCIPAYRQLIEDCWAQHPDQRPSSREVVARLDSIIKEVCPEVEGYDATAEADYQVHLENEPRQLRKERPQDKLRTKKDVQLAIQMAGVHSMMGAELGRQLLTQSIKELAASRCSKSDLIGCMEEFVKQRRESLHPQAAATFDAKEATTINGGTEEAEAEAEISAAGSPAYAIRGSKKPKRERRGTPCPSPGSSPTRRASVLEGRKVKTATAASPISSRHSFIGSASPPRNQSGPPSMASSRSGSSWTTAYRPRSGSQRTNPPSPQLETNTP